MLTGDKIVGFMGRLGSRSCFKVIPGCGTVGQAYFIFGAGAGAFSSKLNIQSPNWSLQLPTIFLELELELLAPRKVLKKEPELSAPESVFRAGAGAFDSLLYFRL